ncbi:hypothetical protein ACFLTY_05530 [Chloroflexota bacterium]
MKDKDILIFNSEGDLEVAVLSENLEAFYGIINPDLYTVLGHPPNQNVEFHNPSCFDLFLIRVQEVFAEGSMTVSIDDKSRNFSLLGGSIWFCERHPEESKHVGLTSAASKLQCWLKEVKTLEFWTGEKEVQFQLTRQDLISDGANLCKHNLLRLSQILRKIEQRCKDIGILGLKKSDIVGIVKPFLEELRSRLTYHASYLIEMLFDYFAAINRIVINRRKEWRTNDPRDLKCPEGLTSWSLKDLYSSTLALRSFEESKFHAYRPTTTRYLKLRY